MRIATLAILVLCIAAGSPAAAQQRLEYAQGQQLYLANCDACHNERIHWRVDRQATDWQSLKFQVRRWQRTIPLDWSEEQVTAVAHYLNGRFYFYPVSTDRAQSGPGQVIALGPASPLAKPAQPSTNCRGERPC